jgi:hypothetical protein
MPLFWYLKAVSSVTWSSVVSLRKFILFGRFLAFVSSFLQLSCLGITGHLYLKLTACVNKRNYLTPRTWCYLRWPHKMAPTIGGICEDHSKDCDDIVVKERPKLSNKQGKLNVVTLVVKGKR